ncbi:Membrane-associated phospholipid phosphatase [Cryobacterium flavum]|uniref:Membrane-associated phospholipid phosphatase n=1 Tax=Cryobacterium flavum TaxID=1424659 RepID=A0A4R8UXF8_9MICO|nr:phosphatase PAP2 family protein [Cryobacterium flavum]TFB72884.1 phosphatase PAP2 family protein [Cryobacterium flavum]SDO43675.1 Membrane-associated phospholipid phosphatase [Cryobacterium flavum]
MDAHGNPEVAATPPAKRVTRRWPLISGVVALLLCVGLGAYIVFRDNGAPFSIDTGWMNFIDLHRAPAFTVVALALNFIGGGWPGTLIIPVLIIVLLVLLKRPWGAGYFLVATALTGGLVQVLKHLFGRARPGDIIVTVDFGSFPSGHAANAAVMAVLLSILFPFWWMRVAGTIYTIGMMLSRTYVGAHWLSDTVGAMLLGIGVAIVLWAPVAAKLDGERELARLHPSGRGHAHPPGRVSAWRVWFEKYVVERRYLEADYRRRCTALSLLLIGVGTLVFAALLVSVIQRNGLTSLDAPVQDWLASLRSPGLTAVMIVLAVLFGPIALPIILLVVTVTWGFVTRHAWRPLVLAGAMLIGVVLAQIIGHLVDRSRPPTDLMLFGADPSFSFPSGHVLGASDFVLLTAYLVFSRRKGSLGTALVGAFAVLCIVAAAVSRVYLGYHWASDVLASVSLSLIIVGCVIAFDSRHTVPVPHTGGVPTRTSTPTLDNG